MGLPFSYTWPGRETAYTAIHGAALLMRPQNKTVAAELHGIHFPGNDCLETPLLLYKEASGPLFRGELTHLHKKFFGRQERELNRRSQVN